MVCVKKIKIMGGRVEKWREVEDAPAVSRVWGKKNEEEWEMREPAVSRVRKKMKKKKWGQPAT